MDLIQVFLLAILQGLTEFLPISSSAHLILLPVITGWQDQGLAFDVAVHVGTLSAVMFYFRKELKVMGRDWGCSVIQRRKVGDSTLAWAVLFGTIPLGIAGLCFHGYIEVNVRSPAVIAWATIVFGLTLWWADARGKRNRDEHGLNWKDILVIGCAQAIALIPGTSRSGITMTAALMMGLSREASARFSFLLSIPAILLAGGLKGLELIQSDLGVDWLAILLGILLSAVTAYLCIHYFLKLLERIGMLPFVVYRLILGVVLLTYY